MLALLSLTKNYIVHRKFLKIFTIYVSEFSLYKKSLEFINLDVLENLQKKITLTTNHLFLIEK